MEKRIIDHLPKIYQHFLPDFFSQNLPDEKHATCHDCAMVRKENESVIDSSINFLNELKCCTYYPLLPNYLIGALLCDENPAMAEGRRRICDKIKNRLGVTPTGIFYPKKYIALSKMQTKCFGRSKWLLCPYFESQQGKCTIWPYRNSVCSSWFCKFNNGYDGFAFWNQLREYISHTETQLSAYALLQLNWDPDIILSTILKHSRLSDQKLSLSANDMDDLPLPPEQYNSQWVNWSGKEEELYIQTFNLINSLTNSEFTELGGILQKIHMTKLQIKYQQMFSPVLPDYLQINPDLKSRKMPDGSKALSLWFNEYTGINEVSGLVYEVLNLFDGTLSNDEICQTVIKTKDVELGRDLIQAFYQERILLKSK